MTPGVISLAERFARGKPDESKGPVCWCVRCHRERVEWDWRLEEQVCTRCLLDERTAVPSPLGAA